MVVYSPIRDQEYRLSSGLLHQLLLPKCILYQGHHLLLVRQFRFRFLCCLLRLRLYPCPYRHRLIPCLLFWFHPSLLIPLLRRFLRHRFLLLCLFHPPLDVLSPHPRGASGAIIPKSPDHPLYLVLCRYQVLQLEQLNGYGGALPWGLHLTIQLDTLRHDPIKGYQSRRKIICQTWEKSGSQVPRGTRSCNNGMIQP